MIDSEDMVTIAKTLPDFTYSWSNSFRYKDLFLNVLIVGVQGNDIVNLGKFMLEGGTDGVGRNLLNRWTPENEIRPLRVTMYLEISETLASG